MSFLLAGLWQVRIDVSQNQHTDGAILSIPLVVATLWAIKILHVFPFVTEYQHIVSSDPLTPPEIDPQFLSHEFGGFLLRLLLDNLKKIIPFRCDVFIGCHESSAAHRTWTPILWYRWCADGPKPWHPKRWRSFKVCSSQKIDAEVLIFFSVTFVQPQLWVSRLNILHHRVDMQQGGDHLIGMPVQASQGSPMVEHNLMPLSQVLPPWLPVNMVVRRSQSLRHIYLNLMFFFPWNCRRRRLFSASVWYKKCSSCRCQHFPASNRGKLTGNCLCCCRKGERLRPICIVRYCLFDISRLLTWF